MIIDVKEEIYLDHFGVKGMKWGVRKQEKREARAKKFEKKAEGYQTRINKLNQRQPSWTYTQRDINRAKQNLAKEREKAKENARKAREGKMTSGRKKAVVGAGVAGAILAAYGTYVMVESGESNRKIMQGRELIGGEKGWKKDSSLSRPDMSSDELMSTVVRDINPDYGQAGTKNNCRRGTYAYEMRRRGNDVRATKTATGRGQTPAGAWNARTAQGNKDFVGPGIVGAAKQIGKEARREQTGEGTFTDFVESIKADPHKAIGEDAVYRHPDKTYGETIFNHLGRQPDGSRGELGVTWTGGGGHSVAYEIVKGKPVIFDTQIGRKFESPDDFFATYGDNISNASTTRLDDKDFNEDFLRRWVRNA